MKKPWTIKTTRSTKDHRHYPRIVAPNGKVTWVAPHGYVSASAAERACKRLMEQMQEAGFVLQKAE